MIIITLTTGVSVFLCHALCPACIKLLPFPSFLFCGGENQSTERLGNVIITTQVVRHSEQIQVQVWQPLHSPCTHSHCCLMWVALADMPKCWEV